MTSLRIADRSPPLRPAGRPGATSLTALGHRWEPMRRESNLHSIPTGVSSLALARCGRRSQSQTENWVYSPAQAGRLLPLSP